METVKRLTREVRIQAKYERSLEVLNYLKSQGIERTKSGIMLGLGETEEEVFADNERSSWCWIRYHHNWDNIYSHQKNTFR